MSSKTTNSMLLMVILAILSVGCGRDNEPLKPFSANSSRGDGEAIHNPSTCSALDQTAYGEIYKDIVNLTEHSSAITRVLSRVRSRNSNLYGRVQYPRPSEGTVAHPLTNNEKIIEHYNNEIKLSLMQSFSGKFYSWFIDGFYPKTLRESDLSSVEWQFLSSIISQIAGLSVMAESWKFDRCNLDALKSNGHSDVREYVILEKARCRNGGSLDDNTPYGYRAKCVEDLLKYWRGWARAYDSLKLKASNLIKAVCEKNRGESNTCNEDWEKSIQSRSMLQFFDSEMNRFKEKFYDSFFLLENKDKHFQCHYDLGRSQLVMKIPVDLTELDPAIRPQVLDAFKAAVDIYWNLRGSLSLEVFQAPSGYKGNVLGIHLVAGDSHVNMNKPLVIHLSYRHLGNNLLLQRVLAHELGHSLGFPDCYVKYFDQRNNWTIYYEIERTNLMCSIQSDGGYIPNHYFLQLAKDKCLLD